MYNMLINGRMEDFVMESKKIKKAMIGGIATCVGIFGGAKLYMNKKKEKAALREEERKQVLEDAGRD